MKKWLVERFLPMWAKQTVLQENRSLQRENMALQAKVRELESYIRGLHRGGRMCSARSRGADSSLRSE